ncbi:MAG: PilZ domain-containing protein [Phycisphaerales bacterium]|nr:PilZ domain-containing protein [Phycisphaerales bacterium]
MSYDIIGKAQGGSAHRNTLGVDGILYERLLAKLDETSGKNGASAKRVFRRLSYEKSRLTIHIMSEGHNSVSLVVATRNLSQGGISVLHSNFMYNGTALTVDLINKDGVIVPRHGTVTRCIHRGGRIHEIGIRFDDEISLRDFLVEKPDNLLYARERIDPEEMKLKLLVYTEDSDFSAVLRQYLMPSNLCYTFAKDLEEAQKKSEDQEMILVHIDPKSMNSTEFVRSMRMSGFRSPILLVGNPGELVDEHIINACGADMVLPWPVDGQSMLCSIGEYIFNEWTPESLENIRMCISPDTKQSLQMELARMGVIMDQQIRTKNQKQVHTSCMKIRVIAPLLGLSSMNEQIESLTERVAVAENFDELVEELNDITTICKGLSLSAA